MLKRRKMVVIFAAFAIAHGCLLFAGFFAPYQPTEQYRQLAYATPTRVHFVSVAGRMHLRPFLYRSLESDAGEYQYSEDRSVEYPIQFFTRKRDGLHLFAVAEPGQIFLFGTDGYGRDIFSRVLFGGRISVAAALFATLLSLLLGASLGAVAGHFGGVADALVMRGAELVLALPWIYLLLAVRAFLPLHISATATFFLVSGVIGIMGWARPARLIRGVVLSAREQPFVMAARGFGASEWYLLRRHVLPQAWGIVITQSIILVPQFVTAEATLSFLGLGMAEPVASWGNMLSALQHFQVMTSYWWMAAPIGALVLVSITYFGVADALDKARLNSGENYA